MGVPSSPLVEIFGQNSSAELLVFLVYNHGNEFTVAEIVEKTKISRAKVNKMKTGLLKYGIIRETKKVGKNSYYRYDRNSKMGKMLYELVFNAGMGDKALASAAATATPSQRTLKDNNGANKIIIA